MSALGVTGDPGGWQHVGDTFAAAAVHLRDQLDAADAAGGSGLAGSWHGPVADAHQQLWGQRQGRYRDLVGELDRAATAFGNFAVALAGFVKRAADLEQLWLGLGLHLTPDGTSFTLPSGWESLEHEALAILHNRLSEAVRDVEGMWTDISDAIGTLATVIESVIDAVEDFNAIELSVAGGAIEWAYNAAKGSLEGYFSFKDFIKDPMSLADDVLDTEAKAFKVRAEHNLRVAERLSDDWAQDGDADVRVAGDSLVSGARDGVKVADSFEDFARVGDKVLGGAAIVLTGLQVVSDAGKHGLTDAIEENAGNLASLAAAPLVGAAVDAGVDAFIATGVVAGAAASAPVLMVVGGAVVTGVVLVGVGDVVQHEADLHKAGLTRALNDVGHGIESAAAWSAEETGLTPAQAG